MSRASNKTYRGVIQDRNVVLQGECDLAEGTPVEVRLAETVGGSPGVVLAAVKAAPQLDGAEVDQLMQGIDAGRRPVRFESSLN